MIHQRTRRLVTSLALIAIGCGESTDSSKAQLSMGGEAIECEIGTGSGNAPAPGEEDAELTCESEFSSCTDGHTYQATCTSTQGSGTSSCTCYVDGAAASKHPIDIADECPLGQEDVLAGCGWTG